MLGDLCAARAEPGASGQVGVGDAVAGHHAGTPTPAGPGDAATPGWRPRWLVELALVPLGYYVYSLVADRAPREVSAALRHTRWLRRVEADLHIGVEHGLNVAWSGSRLRMYAGNVFYDGAHFLVPAAVLVWMFLRHPHDYRFLRRALLLVSLLGLVVFFVWPVAPPRLLPGAGFVDTVARAKTFMGGGSHGITSAENPFAAMPSLHVAWSLWAAVCLVRLARRTWVKVLACLDPVVTTLVIMLTGNHLLLDAVGGVLVVVAGLAAAAALDRLPAPLGRAGRRPG